MNQHTSNPACRREYALSLPMTVMLFCMHCMTYAQTTTGYYFDTKKPKSENRMDTIVTFNPDTYEETVQVVKNHVYYQTDEMPRYVSPCDNCESLGQRERDQCSQASFIRDVQKALKEQLPNGTNLKPGEKLRLEFTASIQNGKMTVYCPDINGPHGEINKAIYKALDSFNGRWINGKVNGKEVGVEVLIPIEF